MASLEQNLKTHFGYEGFREGQRPVIELILGGNSAGAVFPTGSGKSLCYQLPALSLPGITLVVSPLLSLMKDQVDFLASRKIPAARLDSTLDRHHAAAVLEDAKAGRLKILMIAVERFNNARFRFHLRQMKVSLMVVDEAHCISEWGHNFRPEYLKLPVYREEFGISQVLLLTATATPPVLDDMCCKFQLPRQQVLVTGFYRPNLFLQVSPAPSFEKKERLLNRIASAPDDPTIVYVTLQKTAEEVARFLQERRFSAQPYHAGMSAEKRETVQNEFMTGRTTIVVATIAFGMGIDKRDIRRVIHYDLPKSIENYSQEIGRAGRDGKDSFCEILACRDSIPTLENFVYGDTPDREAIHRVLATIREQKESRWEFQLTALSNDNNIRLLPLKTLLVYLEMEGIIRPMQTFFGEFAFKLKIEKKDIINFFEGERRDFVQAVFDCAVTKTIWTYLDPAELLKHYKADHKRITAALEYFDQKDWIELSARKATEVMEILKPAVDIEAMTTKMHHLFTKKESAEIQRIHATVDFFERDNCLSRGLATYFGEEKRLFENCGHCSVCHGGKANLAASTDLTDLESLDYRSVSDPLQQIMKERFSSRHLVRFLCGINTPVFSKMKIKTLPFFGCLEKYPYRQVEEWVFRNRH